MMIEILATIRYNTALRRGDNFETLDKYYVFDMKYS